MTAPQHRPASDIAGLIVALDIEPGLEARALVSKLINEAGVRWFKIGVPMLLHAQEGARTANFIRWRDQAELMLDLKLYDIGSTVRRAVDAAVAMGASMLTVHADSVIHTIDERRIKILSVRGLTDGTADDQERASAEMADGIICSVTEARWRRPLTDKLLVCPGIRPAGAAADEQMFTATPGKAQEAGADFIVVGRPIINARDPVAVVHKINAALRARQADQPS